MPTDGELRSCILDAYYRRRQGGFVELSERAFGGQIAADDIFRISRQLGEHGLIEFSPHWKNSAGSPAVNGRITAHGIDVIEGNATPSIAVHIDKSQYDVSQVFHGNVSTVAGRDVTQYNISIEQYFDVLVRAIENSKGIPAEEKASLIQKIRDIAYNPYVAGLSSGALVQALSAILSRVS